ncbi:restriction endonuclease subunit S, partial [Porphyromonas levii]
YRSYPINSIDSKQIHNGDILLEKSGGGELVPVARVVLWDRAKEYSPCLCANFIQVLRTKRNEVIPMYLMHLLTILHTMDIVRLHIKQTTGIQNLSLNTYLSQSLPLPPLEEQRAIAEYLDRETVRIDRIVELLTKQRERYAQLKRSLISEVVTHGLPHHNYTMKEANLPWLDTIPEHWEISRAKDMFKRMSRSVKETDEIITCFRDGQVTLRKLRRKDGFTESFKEIGYQGIRKGDLVIHQMDAFAGAIGISDSDGKGTPVYICLQPINHLYYNTYYAYLLREMASSQFIFSLRKGIRERSCDFRYDTFATLYLPVPPLEEQQEIVAYLDERCKRLDRLVEAIDRKIELLGSLKKSLIEEVVTGQRRITN